MKYRVVFGTFGPYPQHTILAEDQVAATLAKDPPFADLVRKGAQGDVRVTLGQCLEMGGLEAIEAPTAPESAPQPDAGQRPQE